MTVAAGRARHGRYARRAAAGYRAAGSLRGSSQGAASRGTASAQAANSRPRPPAPSPSESTPATVIGASALRTGVEGMLNETSLRKTYRRTYETGCGSVPPASKSRGSANVPDSQPNQSHSITVAPGGSCLAGCAAFEDPHSGHRNSGLPCRSPSCTTSACSGPPKDGALMLGVLRLAGGARMFRTASRGRLEYADVFPLIYLKLKLESVRSPYRRVKHLLVDEMQDYTPVQYPVLEKLFNCKKTVLGDVTHSINPYSASKAEEIK
nr:UvrD-helicase domain-containing protein [Salinisphaera halophila]